MTRPVDVSRGPRPTKDAVKRDPVAPCRAAEAMARLDDLRWFALRVTPQREFAVVDALAARGVFALTPTVTVYRRANRAARAARLRTYPSAPGYVLAGLIDHGKPGGPSLLRWASVFGCADVREVVANNGRPVELRRREGWRCGLTDEGVIDPALATPRRPYPHPVEVILAGLVQVSPEAARHMRPKCEFSVGDVARVCEGPFEGLDAAVVALDADEATARIVVEIFGAAREVVAPIHALAKAG